jgi:hypothetical protein
MMVIGSDMATITGKKHDPDGMIKTAVEALRILIRQDREKKNH